MAVAGAVDLDEPLASLLPEGAVVPSLDGQEITVRHLATHMSGLPRLPKGMMLRALLRPGRLAQGHDGRLRPTPPWNLADLAGAGGLWSTAADRASCVRAQLDCGGPAELAEAIRFSRQVEHRSSRFAWMHLGWTAHRLHPRQGAHLQIWHNGGTGGFSSFVGFDPETGTAVIVLSNTRRSVDAPSFELLRTLRNEASSRAV
ncbi:serine hydrolase domain-containing protein [Streptomyces sp. NPDC059385]|uniref:serine hydrolase domain-containing protein n=1 Tax=Streptomyces sp. NPDC059385 TaxID=3346817 RepID=UPI0036B0D5D3